VDKAGKLFAHVRQLLIGKFSVASKIQARSAWTAPQGKKLH